MAGAPGRATIRGLVKMILDLPGLFRQAPPSRPGGQKARKFRTQLQLVSPSVSFGIAYP
ncbi:uncharacterized protein EI90DRAFT_3030408 [Cantharellus anzutake]|uniref:uncharacterized protein n=1 Tax=Cantharellus anzutake TaxID=1750568 RepID=UPI001902CA89|nr:uncharacterized protein EI90DRAFT_3030408 [Cantharellus anzutake]KAF8342844.1 hypothetical protein EI90DRAFT_3030408 [Cantharellus anzutake]